jgi:hypothetical protein
MAKLLEKLNNLFEITLVSNVESPKDDVYLNAYQVQELPVRDNDHLILADEADEFAAAVRNLLEDVEQRNRFERNARHRIGTHSSCVKIADFFADICREVAARISEVKQLPGLHPAQNAKSLCDSTVNTSIERR